MTSNPTKLTTGFRDLDGLTGGLHNGSLTLIAARPGMGKTSLALCLFRHLAAEQKVPVVYFSLKHAKIIIEKHLISAQPDADYSKGIIDDRFSPRSSELIRQARRYRTVDHVQCIIIDSLQEFSDYVYDVRNIPKEKMDAVLRSLKVLAIELDIPIIVLSPLSRTVEGRRNHRPTPYDLRHTVPSALTAADQIWFLYRESYYHFPVKKSEEALLEIDVTKNSYGETGCVYLEKCPGKVLFKSVRFATYLAL